ncbi:MAG: TadE/TadG family type IV pilus assembly protein [Candidatus Limnocylindrales bacterium]
MSTTRRVRWPLHCPAAELDRRGQALVEFALILPVLMLILMSIIQLGFIFGAQIGLINGVREGARYGSLTPTTGANASTVGPAVRSYLTTTVLSTNVMGYRSTNLRSSSVTYCGYQNPGASTYSVRLTVSARYGHPLFIPLVGVILDGFDGTSDSALAITSTERFRVENMPLNASEVTSLPAC